jgi:hypothetical protein
MELIDYFGSTEHSLRTAKAMAVYCLVCLMDNATKNHLPVTLNASDKGRAEHN